jgi:hypothetical protein
MFSRHPLLDHVIIEFSGKMVNRNESFRDISKLPTLVENQIKQRTPQPLPYLVVVTMSYVEAFTIFCCVSLLEH